MDHDAALHAVAPDPELADRTFDRILIIKPSSLGDIVHALPVLHGLRSRYPDARIDWLAGAGFVSLIEHLPDLSRVIPFDRRRFGRMWRSAGSLRAFIRFCRDLRSQQYDLVIDLQGLFRSGFLARVSGARCRLGFAEAREGAPLFYTHTIPHLPGDVHAVDRNRSALRRLGMDAAPAHFDLALTDDERNRASALLLQSGISRGDRFIAVMPGARWETKLWPATRFAEAIDAMTETSGMPAVLLAGPDEAQRCANIARLSQSRTVDLSGKTTLRELIALIERAELVVCQDSAPMHLAAALSRPLVSLFGPTNPNRTGPYASTATVLQASLPCVPCYLRHIRQCPYDHACMTSIMPADVARAASTLVAPIETGQAVDQSSVKSQ